LGSITIRDGIGRQLSCQQQITQNVDIHGLLRYTTYMRGSGIGRAISAQPGGVADRAGTRQPGRRAGRFGAEPGEAAR